MFWSLICSWLICSLQQTTPKETTYLNNTYHFEFDGRSILNNSEHTIIQNKDIILKILISFRIFLSFEHICFISQFLQTVNNKSSKHIITCVCIQYLGGNIKSRIDIDGVSSFALHKIHFCLPQSSLSQTPEVE